MWSKNSNELVSTHGFSAGQVQNSGKRSTSWMILVVLDCSVLKPLLSVCIWRYPTMHQVANLTGHTYRVLYLAMSPDVSLYT